LIFGRCLVSESTADIKAEAQRIFDRFIVASAPEQVNLPTLIMRSLQANMTANKVDSNLFAEAQAEVFRLMERDSFATRFLPMVRKRFGA
jgi:hypothetical protein